MFKTLDDLFRTGDLTRRTVLVRCDLNVPMADGQVTDATRIERTAPTLKALSDQGLKVAVLAHFGRPKGEPDPAFSLDQVVVALSEHLGRPVGFAADCIGGTAQRALDAAEPGDVILLENTRFHSGEKKNDPDFVAELAKLADFYVNDAFSAAHRAHASTCGLARALPAFAGRSMQAELEHLAAALEKPARPVMAIVGGAKVSTKIDLLMNLIEKVDVLAVGGGMANTFLAARGIDVKASLCEHDMGNLAREIMAKAEAQSTQLLLPVDGIAATAFSAEAPHRTAGVNDLADGEMMLDIGPESVALLEQAVSSAKTVVWNGPVGAFELEPYAGGSRAVGQAIGKATAAGDLISVAGGGDTVAALADAGVSDQMTYVSTAGGAFLEWMEGKELPGVAALG